MSLNDKSNLQSSKEKFFSTEMEMRTLANLVPVMLLALNREGQFEFANQRFLDYFGKEISYLNQCDWSELFSPDEYEHIREEFHYHIKNQTPLVRDLRLRRHDGQLRWHLTQIYPCFDQGGQLKCWYGSYTDIHDYKVSMEALKASDAKLKLAMTSARMGSWSINLETGELEISDEVYELMGYNKESKSAEEIKSEIIYGSDRQHVDERFNEAIYKNIPYKDEFRVVRADGEIRWIMSQGRLTYDRKGLPVSMEGMIMDIHDQKMATEELSRAKAAAEKANESKSSFLANVSHEIRTPMTAVLGFAELLRDSILSEDDKTDAILRIERSGKALLKLIDNVLDLSKIEAGQIILCKETFSVCDLGSEVIGLFKPVAEQKKLELIFKVEENVPAFVTSDLVRIRQILLNLIGNAIKFTAEGSVTLKLKMSTPGILEMEVRDTGIGISKESQGFLFRPFVQADGSITRRFGGTGLGLALSKRFCELLGGSLCLTESEYGRGSCFVARVEALPVEAHPEVVVPFAKEENPRKLLQSLLGHRILVAEDGLDNQVLLKAYLEKAGALVQIAGNGDEAYQAATKESFDLVLMDIQMPIMDGLQATKKLRQIGYSKPILALTAHAMKEEVARSFEAGCNDHLNKPISRAALISTVEKYIHPSMH